jgi:hypothetical protein
MNDIKKENSCFTQEKCTIVDFLMGKSIRVECSWGSFEEVT